MNAPARAVAWQRFTLDGDPALERHLDVACQRMLSGVRGIIPSPRLEAVLLGGGYGRGEGGVWRTATGDRPYNDLEFYVAVQGNRQLNELRYGRALAALGEILTHLVGVEVESTITSLAELRRQPVSMFTYDLMAGHRLLGREASWLGGCDHHLAAAQIPLAEGTRLLMNRGTGLLLAQGKLAAPTLAPSDAEFIRRNLAKAELACGDAVLVARGEYDWSCRERHRRIDRLAQLEPSPWHEALRRHHAAGVAFKLHPGEPADPQTGAMAAAADAASSAPPCGVAGLQTVAPPLSRDALAARHAEVSALTGQCWLWLEQRRLGRTFASARAYAQDPVDKCPGTAGLRNTVLSLRADGLRPQLHPRPWRHPRQRIFHALALLLWDATAVTEAVTRAQLQRELRTRATSFAGLVHAYEALWVRVR